MSKFFYSLKHQFEKLELMPILLVLSTLLALWASNSSARFFYQSVLHQPLSIGGIDWGVDGLYLINEGLMVLFFVLVTLEIKREFLRGRLRHKKYATLPFAAALGGVVVPALIYMLFNYYEPVLLKGWAIPTATDIAFSLAVLTLLGSRIPVELKLLLSGLAVIDDLCAVLVIAIFYTEQLQWLWVGAGLLLLAVLWYFNKQKIRSLYAYIPVGIALWLALLRSGIHPTIAGVLLGCTIPLNEQPHEPIAHSSLHRLEANLKPFVNYLILPTFAFMNAGVPLSNLSFTTCAHPVFLGVCLGLCFGKPIGIVLGTYGATVLGVAKLPANIKWRSIVGMSCLGGIGFTMSLFVSTLAFSDLFLLELARQAILIASGISASIGIILLMRQSTQSSSHIQ
jgi:NhaA family Na+:H+ antiporter